AVCQAAEGHELEAQDQDQLGVAVVPGAGREQVRVETGLVELLLAEQRVGAFDGNAHVSNLHGGSGLCASSASARMMRSEPGRADTKSDKMILKSSDAAVRGSAGIAGRAPPRRAGTGTAARSGWGRRGSPPASCP